MHRPLEGLLVLALEQAVAAPYCSCRLADAGARVIKVERAQGDFARFFDNAVDGMSSYFVWLNRCKQSLVADIKNSKDAALLHAILESADIFIQNLAPGGGARGVDLDMRSCAPLSAAHHRRHFRIRRGRRSTAMKALTLLGAGGERACFNHGTPGRPRPSRGFRMRYRVWNVYACGDPRGTHRALENRARAGSQSEPV